MQSMVEQQWCACGKKCKGIANFQQILESADAGLTVFYPGSQLDETETTRDRTVFIMSNNKEVEMSSHDIQKALDPSKISCPRCFHIYKRAQILFKNISSLDKKETMGICDHCVKLQHGHSFAHSVPNRAQCKCKKITKRFLTSQKELDLTFATDATTKPWHSESKFKQESFLLTRHYHSDDNLCKALSRRKEPLAETTFSFSFPKEKDKVADTREISSSELLRDMKVRVDETTSRKKIEHKKPETKKEKDEIKPSIESKPKPQNKVKDPEKPKHPLEKESKYIEKPKPTKKSELEDVDKLKSQKEKEKKDVEKSKPQKEKDIKDVEKTKTKKEKATKDVEKPKPQNEKETKDVAKSKSEKESTKKNGETDNLFKELLLSGARERAENEKNKKQQELANEKAKLLAEQKLKELAPKPAPPKVKSVHAELKKMSVPQLEPDFAASSITRIQDKKQNEAAHIIVGQKIFTHGYTSPVRADEQNEKLPLFFKSSFQDESVTETLKIDSPKQTKKTHKEITDPESRQGIIRYALSDRTFIDKGWTKLPTEKVVRKMNVYRMRPAHPEFDWFEHNKNRREMLYDSGEKLAEFSDDGRGRWFYRSGKLALDYYNAEESNAQQRFVVYSNGEPDERGRSRPRTILATFDYSGNGVVFDHNGKIRLKYNQTEGVLLDRSIGPVSHWKWHDLNDPPVLQQVMVDTQVARKDPRIFNINPGPGETNRIRPVRDDDDMLAIEFSNFVKEKSKKLSQNFQPFQIKMKAMKINENFSLKILDQASVYLVFRDGLSNMKVNIGMVLDHKEIVDTVNAVKSRF